MFPIMFTIPGTGQFITVNQDLVGGRTTITSNNPQFIYLFGPEISFNALPAVVTVVAIVEVLIGLITGDGD